MKTVMRIFHILPEVIRGIIVFSLPWFAGQVFRSKSVSFTYLCGQILLWAAFQLVAVPMVFYRAAFSTLFWTYTGIVIVLTAVGALMLLKHRRIDAADAEAAGKQREAWWKRLSPFLIIAILIIGYQMFVYISGMHLDEDDARWIAEANDALVKNKMFLHNPATGEYIGRFVGEMVKDVFSPWGLYIAVLSRWTGMRAAVIAHTVYPPILLGLSYSAYYEIGSQLFKGKHERGIFLLMVSMINMFMAGNAYTQSVFTLTRIWQGKAVVAAVMIPSILAVILRIQAPGDVMRQVKKGPNSQDLAVDQVAKPDDLAKRDSVSYGDWLFLFVTGAACCLFSGMGTAIGLIMIAIYGAYVVVKGLIVNPRCGWKQIPLWIFSLAPSIIFSLGYFRLKG